MFRPERLVMGIRGVGCALLFTLAGCSQAPPPAPDTRDADIKAIHDLEATALQGWMAKDADKISTIYADDANLLMPDSPNLHGKVAIKGALQDLLKDPNVTLNFSSSQADTSKSGDLGYTEGAYTMTFTDPKSKKVLTEKGKYVTVFKKQSDGSWKAIQDMNNADAPAAPGKK